MTKLPKHIRRRINFLTSAWQTSLTACHYNVFTFPFYFVRCIHLYFQHGFTPQETLHLNLHHLKTSISDSYISKKYLLRLQQALNHPSLQCLTEEKSLFYLHCMQLGIPIPRLFGIFCSNSTGFQIGAGALYGEDQWIEFFETHCPIRFVVKPSNGVYGNDILFIDKTDPSFSSASLYHQLTHNIRYSSFVIQERLENHPDLQHINPKMGLQTFRVITLTISPDDIAILYAFFKPITGDNLIDNHRGGETLNLLCPVEVSTGILQDLYIVGKTSVYKPERHPDTNRCLKGSLVPQWSAILNLAKDAAKAFLPLRCIGWDIALCNNGVSIIEANSRWDPLLFGNIQMVTKPIRDLLAINHPVPNRRFSR